MLRKTKSGLYKVRFRVNPKLTSYFNRTEINKVLDTDVYVVANAKADIIHKKYKEIVKVSRLLDKKQIQELVDRYIVETLEQDLISRAQTGQGLVRTSVNPNDPLCSTPALASAYMSDLLKSDYLEDLSNCEYKLIDKTVDELLDKNNIQIDKDSENYKLLNYYMMLAQIEILDEVSKRGYGSIPVDHQDIVKKIFKESNSKTLDTTSIKKSNKSMITLEEAMFKYIKYYKQEATSKGTNQEQITEVSSFLNDVFLPIAGINTDLSLMTLEDIIDLKDLLSCFPIRKYSPYNRMSTKEIVDLICNDEIDSDTKTIGKSTLNKYLGYIKAFFEYSRNTGLIKSNPLALISTTRGGSNATEERLPLTNNELKTLLELTQDSPIYNNAIKALYTSGMRLSELYKYKIVEHNGILTYDLTDKEIKLKTKPSYRIIPVHSLVDVELLKNIPSQESFSRFVNELIREHISSDNRKVLYSLRHSFATDLKNNKVEPTVISELMGHSHQTMTLQRYASGYDVKILKEAVETLSC